jgi:aminoglycoside 3-N-acetyltransferase
MIAFRELVTGFRQIGLSPSNPVIVHASLSSIGDEVRGGAESVLGALLSVTGRVMAPTFTYKTMIIPETGPEDNAASYGSGLDQNRMAEFFSAEMPADRMMGALPEALRRHPAAKRSSHPILSFSAIDLEIALDAQSLEEPFAPVRILSELGGEVLLIGVDQRANTCIHYAERLAGRKQFIRWALTQSGVVECPRWPGCSDGFNQLAPYLSEFTRRARIAQAEVQAIPLGRLLKVTVDLLRDQPQALLCGRQDCERCAAVRKSI